MSRSLLRFILANWRANLRDFRKRNATLRRHCRVITWSFN